MAERRMFSKSVVQSSRFLRLPAAARLLYYDLGMAADDDGAAEGFTVLRTAGASEEDLRTLEERGFITVLNDDLVCYINDWKRNNRIPKDRYHPGAYTDMLPPAPGPGPACTQPVPEPGPACTRTVPGPSPEVRRGKERSGETRAGEERAARSGKTARFSPPSPEEVAAYCRERGNTVDPQRFVDFYTGKGWRIGREPMRDWRAAVRTWESREREDRAPSGRNAMPAPADYESGWDGYL